MKLNLNTKISTSSFFVILSCVFLIRPYYVQINSGLNMIWICMTCIMSCVSILEAIKYKKITKAKWLLIWFLVYGIATYVNQINNIKSVISTFFQVMLAYNIGILHGVPKFKKEIEVKLNNIIYLYIIIDVLLGIFRFSTKVLHLSPEMTFLGYDNYAAYVILPMIAIKWAISLLYNGKITKQDWICWIGEFIYKILYMSFNAVIGLLLLIILYYSIKNTKMIKKLLKPKYALALVIVMLIAVIKFHITDLFSNLLLALGKGTNFGYRTIIWHNLWPVLQKESIIGYGATDLGFFQDTIGLSSIWDTQANHAHNYIFELWFTTGIIGLVIYMFFLWDNLKGIRYSMGKAMRVLLIGVIVYLLMGFIDGYPGITTFYTLLAFTNSLMFSEYKRSNEQVRMVNIRVDV